MSTVASFRQRFSQKTAGNVRELCYGITGPVTIYLDSQAALESRAIFDFKKALLEIRELSKLYLDPGYSHIGGNEMADELARADFKSIDLPIEKTGFIRIEMYS